MYLGEKHVTAAAWFGGKVEAAQKTEVRILTLLLADNDLGQAPVILELVFLAINGLNLPGFLHRVVHSHLRYWIAL